MEHNSLFEHQFSYFPNGLCICTFRRNENGEMTQAVPIVVNEAFCYRAERTATQILDTPLASLFRNFHLITRKYFDTLHHVGQSFTVDLLMEPIHKPVTVTVTLLDTEHFLLTLENTTENQNTEAALLSIGEMWAFSLEGEGDGVWDWEIPQKTIHYSRRFKEILGIQEDGLDFDDFDFKERLHPDDVDAVSQAIHEHVKGLTAYYAREHRMRTDEGTYKWVLTRGKVIKRSAEGRALRMLGTLTDISERRLITEALQRSQQWLAAFFQNRAHGFCVIDRQNHLFLANETLAEMLGTVASELSHRKFTSIVLPADWQAHVSAALTRIWNTQVASTRMEIRLQSEKSLLWVECSLSPILNMNKQVEAVAAIFTDITERKQTAALLHAEQEKLRRSSWLLERRVQELTCLYDVVNILEQIHVPLQEKLQAVVDAIPGAFQSPEHTCARLDVDGQVFLSHNFEIYEQSRIHPFFFGKNRRGLLEVFISTAFSPPEGHYFLDEEQAFLQSVTTQLVLALEQHLMAENNQFLISRLRQSQKAEIMGRCTQTITEEFRDVLSRLQKGYEQHCSHMKPQAHTIIQEALHDGTRLLRFLTFFAHDRKLQTSWVHPLHLLTPLTAQFNAYYAPRIQFHLQYSEDVSEFPLDTEWFGLAVEQLLQNAADSIPTTGDVHVRLSRVRLQNNPAEGIKEGHFLQLQVTDTGVGMTPDALTHLFEPFYTTKHHRKAAGLGLFVALGIVRMHEGTIHVHSQVGHGSVFTCLFSEHITT